MKEKKKQAANAMRKELITWQILAKWQFINTSEADNRRTLINTKSC